MSTRLDRPPPHGAPAPSLSELLSWVATMPPAFRAGATASASRATRVDAVVHDLLQTLTGRAPPASLLEAFEAMDPPSTSDWVLRASWILWHPAFRRPRPAMAGLRKLLVWELPQVAAVVPVGALDGDQDRREELIRRVVRAAGRVLAGEDAQRAADRLAQVDALEHHRLMREAAEREERAREVREALARRAAEEAAAKVSRE